MNTEYDEKLRELERLMLKNEAIFIDSTGGEIRPIHDLQTIAESIRGLIIISHLPVSANAIMMVDIERLHRAAERVSGLPSVELDLQKLADQIGYNKIKLDDLHLELEQYSKKVNPFVKKPKWKNGRNGALNRIICKPQYT